MQAHTRLHPRTHTRTRTHTHTHSLTQTNFPISHMSNLIKINNTNQPGALTLFRFHVAPVILPLSIDVSCRLAVPLLASKSLSGVSNNPPSRYSNTVSRPRSAAALLADCVLLMDDTPAAMGPAGAQYPGHTGNTTSF